MLLEQLEAVSEHIDYEIMLAAKDFIIRYSSKMPPGAKIVPMTRGRVQFEWHKGNKSLEIEVETPRQLHYLLFNSETGYEEENITPIDYDLGILLLLGWF